MASLPELNNYMNQMWTDYIKMTPSAEKIYNLFTQSGENVLNDHIALRTFNHPQLGIHSLAQHFTKYGYKYAGEYFFKEKKLYAQHFQHANLNLPKIFISELELEKMSPFVQETLAQCVHQVSPAAIQNENFVFSGRHWTTSYATYLKLAQESEYASWVYAYGFRPNHFTVSINHLKNFTDIQRLNSFIKTNGFTLNASGGEVKGTPQELLEQSSTMAGEVPCQFGDGIYPIPGCYYEFAKRYAMTSGELYHGFIAKSADKIFESTNKQS
ncbi:MAG: DUF1338 domain-containing protein [Bdellovibrionaceae bacterium]|nr:DUF1338 domain-containing protein [Bdellovibrio sp.]